MGARSAAVSAAFDGAGAGFGSSLSKSERAVLPDVDAAVMVSAVGAPPSAVTVNGKGVGGQFAVGGQRRRAQQRRGWGRRWRQTEGVDGGILGGCADGQ